MPQNENRAPQFGDMELTAWLASAPQFRQITGKDNKQREICSLGVRSFQSNKKDPNGGTWHWVNITIFDTPIVDLCKGHVKGDKFQTVLNGKPFLAIRPNREGKQEASVGYYLARNAEIKWETTATSPPESSGGPEDGLPF